MIVKKPITLTAATLTRVFQQVQDAAFIEGEIKGRRDAARECWGRMTTLKTKGYNTACEECAIFNAAAAERLQIKRKEEQ